MIDARQARREASDLCALLRKWGWWDTDTPITNGIHHFTQAYLDEVVTWCRRVEENCLQLLLKFRVRVDGEEPMLHLVETHEEDGKDERQ